ncbi:MAG: LysM peptidoglycan-binding domain-containing protein [Tepidisphaeraceae bacterium]
MKRYVALTFVIGAGLAVGCDSMNSNKTASAAPSDVLNVSPTPGALPPAMPSAMPQAMPVASPVMAQQSISDSQPVAFVQPSPLPAAPAAAATTGSRSYTVKKGDTLFSIAKTQLGSGRDWQKIVAINPGLSPQKLRVGQQIVLPS